ncbi:MAG: ribonuclease activity regulator RraA, partial [Proteobacteria bacterium]|nr:ribonuclease activity regulator RraA [Pseudomonadota bacterium]
MDKALHKILKNVTTGTLTTVMLKRGIRTTWMRGTLPYSSTRKRVVGPAFTLRFVPAREDLAT